MGTPIGALTSLGNDLSPDRHINGSKTNGSTHETHRHKTFRHRLRHSRVRRLGLDRSHPRTAVEKLPQGRGREACLQVDPNLTPPLGNRRGCCLNGHAVLPSFPKHPAPVTESHTEDYFLVCPCVAPVGLSPAEAVGVPAKEEEGMLLVSHGGRESTAGSGRRLRDLLTRTFSECPGVTKARGTQDIL